MFSKWKKTIAVLDIGSREIAGIAAELGGNGEYDIKEFIVNASRGVPNGIVKDMSQAADSISGVITKLAGKAGKRISEIHFTVSSPSIELVPSRGTVLLSKYGREVLPQDVERCIRVGSVMRLPGGKEPLHKIVREFSIDSTGGVYAPVGLEGVKMGVVVNVIVMDASVIRNLQKCVTLAGYNPGDMVFSAVAASYRMLPEDAGTSGVCFLNIRGDLVETVIFRDKALLDCRVFSLTGAGVPDGEEDLFSGLRGVVAGLTAMPAWGEVGLVVASGEGVLEEDVVEALRSMTGRSVRHGNCSSRPFESLPTDRMRYVGCLGVLDHLQELRRLKHGDLNPFKRVFNLFIRFMDKYF